MFAAATVVVAVAVLLPGAGSGTAFETDTVFVIVEPGVAPRLTRTRRVTTDDWPEGRLASEQETVPVPPTAGDVQLQPGAVETDRNVVFAGIASVRTTASAVAGPLFVAVSVYVRSCPAGTGSGVSTWVTATFALAAGEATVVAMATASSVGSTSVPPLVVVTALFRTVPFATVESTRTTTVKVTVVPVAKLGFEQRTVPAEPTGGVTQDQPAGGVAETNVVPGGRTSVTEAFEAVFGPWLRSAKE